MILSDSNRGVLIKGSPEEIADDMLNIMLHFVEDIYYNMPEGKEIIAQMFYADPEIITEFTRMFIKATHK